MSSTLTETGEPTSEVSSSGTTMVDAILDAVARRLAARRMPDATYRLQVNHTFTFRDARGLVDYLSTLGISDCYLSPCVKACAGTMHGYDIVDHNTLNPEIGSEADYNALTQELQARGMGPILDVVPNHMGVASDDNAWWMDVLENGPGSPYASFFDIDWMPLKPDLAHKVLLPILGDQFGKVLEEQQLVLAFEEGAFWLHYFARRLPIEPHSWAMILNQRIDELQQRLGAEHPQMLEYQSILTAVSHLPPRNETNPEKVSERRREKEVIKRRLAELAAASPEINAFLRENVTLFNGTRGDSHSFDLLDQLLRDQPYRLAYWRVAADEINYRRFFDVNELAAICMERPEVFQKTHGLILRLLAEGKVTGLRIDHPDGLYDPAEYLWRLQRARFLQLCRQTVEEKTGPDPIVAAPSTSLPTDGEHQGDVPAQTEAWEDVETELGRRFDELAQAEKTEPLARPLYLVVEKILEPGERLPDNWPVYGTTGYDFANVLNGIFVDRSRAKEFDRLYARFLHRQLEYKELVYRCKKLIMQASMAAEINVLGHQLDRISELNRRSRDFTLNSLTEALREVIACFPVYRTYVTPSAGALDRDRRYIEQAVARAKSRNPATSASIFDLVRDILLLSDAYCPDDAARAEQQHFVGRFQQVTGPVMAKSVEDTAFYRYNRLVSLNEVGGDPEQFGTPLAIFHQQNLERQAHWPHSLLATSTHDTKRSEDVRARINVLSEIPNEFRARVFKWARLNQGKKTTVEDEPAPSRNDEYLLYQTLLGSWPLEPLDAAGRAAYTQRIQQYMLKATHEAKAKTSWVSPNDGYERATHDFVAALLDSSRRNRFLVDFEPFARRIAELGMWNSLSQTVLKLSCPGVPDLYQGTELWDFSLVDPDNRRPVDYARRRKLLQSLRQQADTRKDDLSALARELVEDRIDGRIKLYVIWKMLSFRRDHAGCFTTGRYIPLDATGATQEHLCAFARKTPQCTVLIVIPRLIAGLVGGSANPPIGADVWSDAELLLPQQARGATFRNIFTEETLNVSPPSAELEAPCRLAVSSVLRTFPVAVLERVDDAVIEVPAR
jgi:(1->4)-alpha-D-glucan 1-alpha-D-glucosylmutase